MSPRMKKNHVTCEVHHHNHFKREFLLLFFLQLLAQDNDTCARPSIPLMDICPPFLFLAVAVVLLLHRPQLLRWLLLKYIVPSTTTQYYDIPWFVYNLLVYIPMCNQATQAVDLCRCC